jgi:hypothetical protein
MAFYQPKRGLAVKVVCSSGGKIDRNGAINMTMMGVQRVIAIESIFAKSCQNLRSREEPILVD